MKTKKKSLWGVVCVILIIALSVTVILKRQWLNDYLRGMGYQPVGEMGRIMRDLELTDEGEFVFKAAQPVLNSQDEFNENCRTTMDEEMAVLGCYADGDIYVYNIESAELDGIRELTTAHELLHAVWERMNEGERQGLTRVLTETFDKHKDALNRELSAYDVSEKQEELFVRAGTEIANLPTELEEVYGRVFVNQDKVVGFYDKYIGVFRAMEAEMEQLSAQMEAIQADINRMSSEYEQRVGRLNMEIDGFNACADTVGCFGSEGEFYARRGVLVEEQNALEAMYEQVNNLVNQYNELVEKYNSDVTRTEKLNRAMNSNSKPEAL